MFGNLVIHEGKGAQSKRLKREFGFKKFWIPVSISFLLPSESAAGNLCELSLDRKGKLRPMGERSHGECHGRPRGGATGRS